MVLSVLTRGRGATPEERVARGGVRDEGSHPSEEKSKSLGGPVKSGVPETYKIRETNLEGRD